jgi:hypothetical protein
MCTILNFTLNYLMQKSIRSINFVLDAKLKPWLQGKKKLKVLIKVSYCLVFILSYRDKLFFSLFLSSS